MPVTFYLPGALRNYAAGKTQVVLEASPPTVAGALELLWRECPGLRDRLANEQNQIREHVNVFVGNLDIRYSGGLQTPLPDGAEISIIPAISGGRN